jgi:membrane-associated PAP2 superfamily phosphatase
LRDVNNILQRIEQAATEAVNLATSTSKVQMVKTKARCTCGWKVVAYVEGTNFVRCLDCKEPVSTKEPPTEYELWVQKLKE